MPGSDDFRRPCLFVHGFAVSVSAMSRAAFRYHAFCITFIVIIS